MGFSRQEYWSGLPLSSPGDLPNPGIELRSPVLQADSLTSELPRNLVKFEKKKKMLYDWTINNPSTDRLFKKKKKNVYLPGCAKS